MTPVTFPTLLGGGGSGRDDEGCIRAAFGRGGHEAHDNGTVLSPPKAGGTPTPYSGTRGTLKLLAGDASDASDGGFGAGAMPPTPPTPYSATPLTLLAGDASASDGGFPAVGGTTLTPSTSLLRNKSAERAGCSSKAELNTIQLPLPRLEVQTSLPTKPQPPFPPTFATAHPLPPITSRPPQRPPPTPGGPPAQRVRSSALHCTTLPLDVKNKSEIDPQQTYVRSCNLCLMKQLAAFVAHLAHFPRRLVEKKNISKFECSFNFNMFLAPLEKCMRITKVPVDIAIGNQWWQDRLQTLSPSILERPRAVKVHNFKTVESFVRTQCPNSVQTLLRFGNFETLRLLATWAQTLSLFKIQFRIIYFECMYPRLSLNPN